MTINNAIVYPETSMPYALNYADFLKHSYIQAGGIISLNEVLNWHEVLKLRLN